jgi:uncharacterized protein (TIGR00255 family)
MIKSMTGFASLSRETEHATLSVTLRAVNHRYLDVQFRLPQALAPAEPRFRSLVQREVARGRIEIAVGLQLRRPPVVEVELNDAFVDALTQAIDRARERGLIAGALTPGDLIRFPQALTVRERPPDADEAVAGALQGVTESALGDALEALGAMRTREGDYLRADLDGRRAALAELIERITSAAEAGRAGLEARLHERIRELGPEVQGDAGALAAEVVRFAARSDISEEIVRFRGHLEHWLALTDGPEPCGRKLDFLLQEMNREVNTIGAKAEGPDLSPLIVGMKAELEKMREQVQNVE